MLERFLAKTQFDSWEDFQENLKITAPRNFNFAFDVVDEIAGQDPDKLALVWCDDHREEASFTFADIKRESNKVANFLQARGIGKGDSVMLILKRRYEFWFCLIALHKLGAVAVPATHLLTAKDIVYRCNAADIKAVVTCTDDAVLEQVDAADPDAPSLHLKVITQGERPGWYALDEETKAMSEELERPTGPEGTTNEDTILLYFTSGTTGLPKMVQHDATYPLGHILTAKYWQNVRDGGLHLTVADTGWAKTAWGKIYGQWVCGSAVFAYDMTRFEPRRLLDCVARHGVTTFCAPPTIYRFLIKEDFAKYDLSKLEYCVVAGEPLNPEVYNAWLEKTGLKLMEGFGQTETVVTLANYPYFEPRAGSMGKPSPGWDVVLLNDDGEQCEVGEAGQIAIRLNGNRPTGLFRGYYRDPDQTASVWHDGVYYTGDLAWYDEDGYYWFVGRADDIIKTSGYRVGPFEVESALLEHPAVTECAITGIPDPMRGQVIKATCVLSQGHVASEELAKELQDHVKHTTAPYKYPRIIEFVDELPKTISGKIRRKEIRDQDGGQ